MIENPQSAWLPLLLLVLPGIAFAAYALNEALFSREERRFCTIPAIGLVLALLPAHVLALTLGSLSVALAVSWSLVGAAGCAWIARNWREFRSALSNRHPQLARRLAITASGFEINESMASSGLFLASAVAASRRGPHCFIV
jgi:hypothetical protein